VAWRAIVLSNDSHTVGCFWQHVWRVVKGDQDLDGDGDVWEPIDPYTINTLGVERGVGEEGI
jgi:hypothetical protein